MIGTALDIVVASRAVRADGNRDSIGGHVLQLRCEYLAPRRADSQRVNERGRNNTANGRVGVCHYLENRFVELSLP